MSSESLHVPRETLSTDARLLHYAITSLKEELDAVDWYRQRAEDSEDRELRELLLHNMREEMEHASMLLEWIRRRNHDFGEHLSTYLFSDGPILNVEKATKGEAGGGGSAEGMADRKETIGSLKGETLMDTLNRGQAPFPDAVWDAIDEAAAAAARDQLTARRFLDLEGPFGVGLTAVEVGNDDYCRQPGPDEAGAIMSKVIPLPMIRKSFKLSIRRVAAHVQNGQPLYLNPAQDAAEAVANREEEMVYQGQPLFNLPGLLTVEGRNELTGGDWSAPDQALQDVLSAATLLDEAGFRGPYALVLAPALYNNLFRLFPGSDVLALEHLRRLCTAGIYKAGIEGGALVDPRVGALILGQDIQAGYAHQDGVHYELYVSESIVLRIDEPKAICSISAHAAKPAERQAERNRS